MKRNQLVGNPFHQREGSGDCGGGVVTSSGPSQDGPLSKRFLPKALAVQQQQRNHCGGETVLDGGAANAWQEAQRGVGGTASPGSYRNGSEAEWSPARMSDSPMDDASKAGSVSRADDNSSPSSGMLRACAAVAPTEPAPSAACVSSRNPGSGGGGGGCETGDRGDETDRRNEPAPERKEVRGGSNGPTGGAAAAVAAEEAVWGGNQAEASLLRPPPLVSGHGEWGWHNGTPLRGGRLPPSRRMSPIQGGAKVTEDSPTSSASPGNGVRYVPGLERWRYGRPAGRKTTVCGCGEDVGSDKLYYGGRG